MKLVSFIILGVVFGYTAMWTPINLFLTSLGKAKVPITIIADDNLRSLIHDRTGIDIEKIKISESARPFGMMVGIPTKPQLVLSRGLYNSFSPDELEYVVLHEAGHYKLQHTVSELIAGVILFGIGVMILRKVASYPVSLLIAVILGVVFGILLIRLGRTHEIQADEYALEHISNPQGMIDATKVFRNYQGPSYTENSNKLIQSLLYRGNPYDNRINMAEWEIEKRSK